MVAWAPQVPQAFDEWAAQGTAVLGDGPTAIEVESQEGGAWLLWFTDLPSQEGGEYYYTTVAEVRFQA